MGRTLPSVTQAFLLEQQNFSQFRRALRRSDQLALDELFAWARNHVAAAAYAANALPMETMLLAMLLEEHKEVMRLRNEIERLEMQLKNSSPQMSRIWGDAEGCAASPRDRGAGEVAELAQHPCGTEGSGGIEGGPTGTESDD